jgi:hypothetical protein
MAARTRSLTRFRSPLDRPPTRPARYAAGGTQVISVAGSGVCQQEDLGQLPGGTAGKILAFTEAQLGKPYLFSGGPGGEITLNPHVYPAQKANVSDSSGATGVVASNS